MELDKQELLENELIRMLREFSDSGYRDFSTGFQRYFARDIMDLVIEYYKSEQKEEE